MGFVSTLVSIGSLVAAAACGGGKGAQAPSPVVGGSAGGGEAPVELPRREQQASQAGLLGRFAAQKLLVLPAQAVTPSDPLGWRASSGGDRVLLASLDAGIEAVLGERGLASLWVFPPALQRAARRNPTYVTDPSTMRALGPVRAAAKKPEDPLAEPFASQLRSLAGVGDARYAFVPLELRLESVPGATPSGTGRAILQLAIVDARGSRVVWIGEVASDPFPAYSPAVLGSLVRRVADLIVPTA